MLPSPILFWWSVLISDFSRICLNTSVAAFLPCFYFLQMIWFVSHNDTLSSTNFFFFSKEPCVWAIQLVPNNHNLILCLSFLLFPAADTPLTWTYLYSEKTIHSKIKVNSKMRNVFWVELHNCFKVTKLVKKDLSWIL